MADFPAPVSRLLTLGNPGPPGAEWLDYLAYGFTAEHVPDLMRLATDMGLNRADPESLEVPGTTASQGSRAAVAGTTPRRG